MYNNLIIKDMNSENTHKCNTITMTESAHNLIIVLNRMSTPRPYDAINSYPIMYKSLNTLIYYADAIRVIANSPKVPFMPLYKKELNALLSVLEQDICFINWREQDPCFEIKEYGMNRYHIIKKHIEKVILYMKLFKFIEPTLRFLVSLLSRFLIPDFCFFVIYMYILA